MQAGKALEHLVAAIQEHLKDNPNAKVTLNAKLPNRSGNIREIDVLVQTKVNGENIGIAFECKDHKQKVTEPIIDAFSTKCRELPQVDKGIIVTTSGFTKGAQKEAKSLKIGLYLIDDLPLDEIIPNYKFWGAKVIAVPQWKELSLHTIVNIAHASFDPEAKVRYADNDEEVNFCKEIPGAIYTTKFLCELAAKYVEVGRRAYKIGLKFTTSRQLCIKDVNGVKYEIDYVEIPTSVDLKMNLCHISSQKKYATPDDENTVLVSEYKTNLSDSSWVVVESGKEESSFFIKNQDNYYQPSIVISGISEKKLDQK